MRRRVVLPFVTRYPTSQYIGCNDVTESMVTIRSPFCGYNLA